MKNVRVLQLRINTINSRKKNCAIQKSHERKFCILPVIREKRASYADTRLTNCLFTKTIMKNCAFQKSVARKFCISETSREKTQVLLIFGEIVANNRTFTKSVANYASVSAIDSKKSMNSVHFR